jgi:hypothetical protein
VVANSPNAGVVEPGRTSVFTSCMSHRSPSLSQHGVDDAPRNPTLSYTQRLEKRVRELEEQLAEARKEIDKPKPLPPSSVGSPEAPSFTSHGSGHGGSDHGEDGLIGSFMGLKLDDKGVITYHGSTSFFQLLDDNATATQSQLKQEAQPFETTEEPEISRRERLVSNAWQQRALEDLSAVPVSLMAVEWGLTLEAKS